MVLRWVWTILALSAAKAALLLTSTVFGPLLPQLCVLDVDTLFSFHRDSLLEVYWAVHDGFMINFCRRKGTKNYKLKIKI